MKAGTLDFHLMFIIYAGVQNRRLLLDFQAGLY